MWNPTSEEQLGIGNKNTAAAAAAEECNCASVQKKSANSGIRCDKCEEEQDFKDNSKIAKLSLEEEENIDSGFLSGFNPSGIIDSHTPNNNSKVDKADDKSNSKGQSKELEESKTYFDSGCIEPDDDNGNGNDEAADKEANAAKTDVVTKRQSEAQVQSELHVATSLTTTEEMRFKNNVDSGISERFCSLSLQNNSSINNLNSTQLRSKQSTSPQQQQQQQTRTKTASWEEFYQQNSEGDTPLHLACLAGAEDVVVALLRLAIHPCLYNIQNDDAQTPLHMAAFGANPKILRLLLIMEAEPNIRDRYGNTALHVAVNSGEEQCVRALLTPLSAAEILEGLRLCAPKYNDKKYKHTLKRKSLDVEIRNYNGERCVHLAAQEGRINILRMLVQCGADINAREGKSGRTPLHIAIESCNEALVNFLLKECQKNLNLETETYAGLTAYQFACLLDRDQLTLMLAKCGAETLTPPVSDYENSDGEDLNDSKIYGDASFFAGYSGRKSLRIV